MSTGIKYFRLWYHFPTKYRTQIFTEYFSF